MTVTRFAPSPTGDLHLGHAYSALFAYDAAKRANGRFLIRIEDIDPTRCRAEFIDRILEDLSWLGLTWEHPVRRQSEHLKDYAAALAKLTELSVVYPCFCTRKEVALEQAASLNAPHSAGAGDGGIFYPGTCRNLSESERQEKLKGFPANWRLDHKKARSMTEDLHWHDVLTGKVPVDWQSFGDIVVARKDVLTSYHLSVTVDDALQNITLVTRGEDLIPSTSVHRVLQALLKLPLPSYRHHVLLTDEAGKRYAKRDKALTVRALRERGQTAEDLKKLISEKTG